MGCFARGNLTVEISEHACVLRKPEGERVRVQQLSALAVGTVQLVRAVFAVAQQRAADRCHMRADLMCAVGWQLTFDQRQLAMAGKCAVTGLGGFGAGYTRLVKRDLLALFIPPQVVFDQSFGRLGTAMYDA